MFSYMDSAGFYIFYLILILVLTGLSVAFCIYQKKERDFSLLERTITALLIISFTIFILDSIPYLFIEIDKFTPINIVLSNIFLFLLGFSTITFELSLLDKEIKSKEVQD